MNERPQGWAPRVRTLLSILFLLVLGLPFMLVGILRLYESALVRQTEEVLLAEAVVVGELYRLSLDPRGASQPLPRPAPVGVEPYVPFNAKLELGVSPLLGPARRKPGAKTATVSDTIVSPVLQRALIRNLSGVRVIDADGVVVASPMEARGYSLAHLEEVEAALAGDYLPVLRQRFSDEPPPPLTSLSRAAVLRVSIAVPVFDDPYARPGQGAKVIGVVYNSRTPLNTTKALWQWRGRLYLPLLLSLLITFGIVAFVTTTIAGPLSRLRRHAEQVASGDDVTMAMGRVAPQEIHALAHSIDRMRDQLESRADYIREFAANTAHELKTPLTSLRGAAELLIEDSASMTDEQRERFLSNIHSDAVRMDGLVRRILELARIESTKPVREPIDLRAFLEGAVERYRRHEHEVDLAFEGPGEIHFAPDLLDTMVTNLLDNAVRHGAGETVDVRVSRSGATVELAVRDRGAKLPADHFDRAFERFYSTERKRGGTGLGLATVRAIANAHGGAVEARVMPDRGATLFVRWSEPSA